ncbi:hypothetical protein, partial [Aeromonas enteropelogenes]|uniref:hypothetical protein n=1 Tax=Aeromonas enteropelogenes TaxID=29489 RepID=UPI003B9DED8F
SKQESGIKRRSSHFSCVNTVPVNTYIRIINISTLGAMAQGHHQSQHTPAMPRDPARFPRKLAAATIFRSICSGNKKTRLTIVILI